MPPSVTFIGWHNSGKTTLICKVVKHLKKRGFKVGVIKSSKEKGIRFDAAGTDTERLVRAGAGSVAFVSPDQAVVLGKNEGLTLPAMAHRFFPVMDLVIGEGFKNAEDVDKIEVVGGKSSTDLREMVSGVIAVAAREPVPGFRSFHPDEAEEIAAFLEARYISKELRLPSVSLLVSGRRIPLTGFLQDCLARTISGFVSSLKDSEDARAIEITVKMPAGDRE